MASKLKISILEKERYCDKLKKAPCPYGSHLATSADISFHLANCRKKNPENAAKFDICIYDCSHHILKEEMATHLQTCEARQRLLMRLEGRPDVEEQTRQLRQKISEDRLLKEK